MFGLTVIPSPTTTYYGPEPKDYSREGLKTLITEAFPEEPIMLRIAECESGTAQFYASSSKVIRSHTADSGLFQINDIWLPKAKELGYDINTVEGNIAMAQHIKEVQGLRAWSCYNKMAPKGK